MNQFFSMIVLCGSPGIFNRLISREDVVNYQYIVGHLTISLSASRLANFSILEEIRIQLFFSKRKKSVIKDFNG